MASRRSAVGLALGLIVLVGAGAQRGSSRPWGLRRGAGIAARDIPRDDRPLVLTDRQPPGGPARPPRGPAAAHMRSIAAAHFRIERDGTDRLLRFSASLANLGPGPLLVRPRAPGRRCPAGRHPAVQVLFRDAGNGDRYRRGRDRPRRVQHAGCMVAHRGHDHWHFDAMAAYVLRDARTGEVVATRRKVSFCLRDNYRAPGVRTTVRREHFGECTRTLHQGISPGWVDIYTANLAGQALRLPDDERRRRYCLDLTADPRNRLIETDEEDNGVSVGIVVRGDVVARRPGMGC